MKLAAQFVEISVFNIESSSSAVDRSDNDCIYGGFDLPSSIICGLLPSDKWQHLLVYSIAGLEALQN